MRTPRIHASVAGATLLLALLGAPVPAAAATSSSWWQLGHDAQRTNHNPDETVLTRSNVGTLRRAFTTPTPSRGNPVIVDGVLYLANSVDGSVQAIDGATGAVRWLVDPPEAGGQETSPPAYARHRIWVGLEDPQLLGLATRNGAVVAPALPCYDLFQAPAAVDGIVYAGGQGDCLVAVNAASATVLWAAVMPQGASVPAVSLDGSSLFVASGGFVDRVSAATGVVTGAYWTGMDMPSTVTVAGSTLLVTGLSWTGSVWVGAMAAVAESSGDLLWTTPSVSGGLTRPAVAGGLVYVGVPGALDAFSLTGGRLVWSRPEALTADPTVADGVVFVDAGASVDMFNSATGARLGTLSPAAGSAFEGSPIPAYGHLYVVSSDSLTGSGALEGFAP